MKKIVLEWMRRRAERRAVALALKQSRALDYDWGCIDEEVRTGKRCACHPRSYPETWPCPETPWTIPTIGAGESYGLRE